MLSDTARMEIEERFRRWRAGITLPAFEDEVRASFTVLIQTVYDDYGPEGLAELERTRVEQLSAEIGH